MKAYPAYRESEEKWMGDIPAHWKSERLQWHLSEIKETNSPIKTKNVLSLTNKKGVIPYEEKGKQGNKSKESYDEYKLAYPNTLVLNSMNVIIGSVGICNYYGCVSPVYYVYKTIKDTSLAFINYIFQTTRFQRELRRHAKGILEIRLRLSSCDILKRRIPIPPIEEQQAIVSYLDKKCAEIDELVSRRQAIIERLKWLKQSIIAKAVTKGLNPDVPMKDCGIKWIGEIPKHWNTEKINSFFRFGKGLSISKADLQEQGIPVISYGQIHSKNNKGVRETEELIRFVDNSYLVKSSKSLLHRNDILFADTSEDVKGIGNCVRISREGEIFAGYHTVIAFNKTGKDTKYWAYLFQSELWRNQLRQLTNGVKVFSISQKNLRKCLIINPPQNEQAMIVSYLDKKCAEIDTLISRQEQIIEKLKELKTSTIAHVVTGKVDVRDTL